MTPILDYKLNNENQKTDFSLMFLTAEQIMFIESALRYYTSYRKDSLAIIKVLAQHDLNDKDGFKDLFKDWQKEVTTGELLCNILQKAAK